MQKDIIKICTGCERELSLDNFWKLKGGKYGKRPKCIECLSVHNEKYYRSKAGVVSSKYREYRNKYYRENKEKYREYRREYQSEYNKKPEQIKKNKCREIFKNAIILGRIERGECEYPGCDTDKIAEGHHWNYSEPYEVTWLCKRHHILADNVRRLLEKQCTIT